MPASAEGPPTVTIRVDAAHPGRTIPQDFFGLSFEADLMHRPWIDPATGNVDELLKNLGTGNIRFSANQVDRTAWMPDPSAPVPTWAKGQQVTPEDLSRVGALSRSTGWSVDLGLNLGHFDPAAAADQAREAQKRIGDSLRSVQIGNEPNFYALAPLLKAGERRPYTPKTYIRDTRKYRDAIRAAAPGIAIEGPDTAGASIGNKIVDPLLSALLMAPWLDPYAAAFGSESKYLNHHYYPFINTKRLGFPDALVNALGGPPTIDKLMSRENARKQTAFLREFTALADRAGLEPRLTETNAVAKEGKEGVTNSFGAALWTVDFLMSAAREGVTGMNLHNQPADCESYSLVCFADDTAQRAGRAQPNPNYYAMLLVSRLSGGRILPATVESGPAHVSAYAVRMPGGGVEVVVNNLDKTFAGDVDVQITGAETGPASVVRLTAASPEATSGTEFAGATVAEDGTFTPGRAENAPGVNGRYEIRVNESSAVLLTVD